MVGFPNKPMAFSYLKWSALGGVKWGEKPTILVTASTKERLLDTHRIPHWLVQGTVRDAQTADVKRSLESWEVDGI